MLNSLKNTFNVTFAENVNTFIFFLKRIPLLGKRISNKIYSYTKAKQIIGIIVVILNQLLGLCSKGLYIYLAIFLPITFLNKSGTQTLDMFFHIFFFLSFMVGSFANSYIFDVKKKDYNMVVLMKCDAKQYFINKVVSKNVIIFIQFFIVIFIAGNFLGYGFLYSIIFTLELLAFKFLSEIFHLYIFTKTRKTIIKEYSIMWVFIIIALVLAYGFPLWGYVIPFLSILLNPFIVSFIILMGILSVVYIVKYKNYRLITKVILTKENVLYVDKIRANAEFSAVQIKDNSIDKEDLKAYKYEKFSGYEYLNTIFFNRHKKIIVEPIKIRVIIVVAVFVIYLVLMLMIPDLKTQTLNGLENSTPILVFVMYIFSSGDKIPKAMFFNCDKSLLRYAFYREGKVILSNFVSRLKVSVLLNLLPAIAISLGIIGVIIASGQSSYIIKFIPQLVSILCLSCFFSIHNLVMYYILQPYTLELTIKSPIYTIIKSVVYMICYICLQIRTTSIYFTYGVIVATMIYMIVAVIATYKVAPKTFKLRT